MTNFTIKNITLQNYKRYSNLELIFSNRVNLLIGENGTGKTSVLDALATLLGGYIQAFKDISSGDRHSISKKDIKIEIQDIDNNIVAKYKTPVVISGHVNINDDDIFIQRLRRQEKNDTKTHLLKTINKNLIDYISKIEENLDTTILPIISYHGTGRLWEQEYKKTSKMEKLTRFDGYKDCLNAKSNYRNFIVWFEKQERNAFSLRKEIPILEAVRESVKSFISQITKKEVELFIYREGDLELKFKDIQKREKVSNLSDGYRNLIGIVSDIAYRMAILNPHLGKKVIFKTSGVVLIDEIDLHLHPKWQREVVSLLKNIFPKVQFIFSSHSPFVIQSMQKNEIIKLTQSNQQLSIDATLLSIEDISENIQDIELPQISKRKLKMLEVADRYLELLDKIGDEINSKELNKIKQELDELIEPFEDNMAYVSFLRRKRLLKEDKNETSK